METTSHLVRMGEELKCPICLSLLKSAVSLTCNHIFCNICIDKSMRADSTCPVCKIPYRRREIRPAPHMDTLVNIYKSMEVSSGVNILVTQTEIQPSGHENQEDDTNNTLGTTQKNQRKNKGKPSKSSSKKPKKSTSDSVGPSFPIKKRIQVPHHHPQETPTTRQETGKSEFVKDHKTQTNVAGLEDTAHLHENEERLFCPFFWLRNEEDDEETIEPTPLDPLNASQPNGPCFSDIKDSIDDDHSCHVTSKNNGNFDSEMFEWTQRPCSPEICASPVKNQEKESEKETDDMEVVLPNLSSLQKVDHEVKVNGSKKRAKKTKESVQKKRVKRDTDKKETTNEQHMQRAKRSKIQDPSNSNGEIKACVSTKQTEKVKVSKKLKASKKVTFSTVKSVDDVPKTSEKIVTKKSQPLGGVDFNSKKESNSKEKPNTMFLHKCDNLSDISCAFCQSKEESNISGCMTHYLKGKPVNLDHEDFSNAIHAHSNCTEWAPCVYFEDEIAVNLEAELSRSKRIKCSCCGIKGASLGCYEKTCHRSFHFPCAKLTPQCRWDYDNFVMLCPLHASHKLPNETTGSHLKPKKKCSVPKRQLTTSRWDTHSLFTKIVLCCSGLTNIEKETIVELEKLSGVTILKAWDSKVTHVVASVDENGACRRTLKYLMGVIEGKWILTFEWIKACLEVKKPVNEQLYEVNLDVYGFTGGPKLGRSRLLNKEPKLFNEMKFYFTGDFVGPYKGYLHDLIIAAGGTVLHRKPVKLNNEKPFLIYSLEIPDKVKKRDEGNLVLSQRKSNAEGLARESGGLVVSNIWVLNSIAACKVQELD